MEAGQVGLRLVTKGERMTTVAKEWNIGASSIADGRYQLVTTAVSFA
jgi:muramidase (phage lysozyme)